MPYKAYNGHLRALRVVLFFCIIIDEKRYLCKDFFRSAGSTGKADSEPE